MIYAVNKRTKEHRLYERGDECEPETWAIVNANPDGWIEWQSSEYEGPMPAGARCEIRLSSGDGFIISDPEDWNWSKGGDQWIIAYRPILDASPSIDVTRIATPEEPPAWDGEGLPPAGCECEVRGTSTGSMCPAVIDYVDGKHCIWHWKGERGETMHARVINMEFRPIRSEEDGAVDEMVAAMEHAIEDAFDEPANSMHLEVAALALYQGRYRKTGVSDEDV